MSKIKSGKRICALKVFRFPGQSVMLNTKHVILIAGLISLVFANVQAENATNASFSQVFQFKFELNKPLIYAVDFKTRTVKDNRIAERSSLTRNSVDTRYKIKLTATATHPDGTTVVCYQPFDYEQDVQSVGPTGQMDITTRGLDIISKQNGILMIDTKKGIGTSQAMSVKQSVYPHLLSGYFDFDSAGHIKNFEGDLPFIDTWQNILKPNVNIFYIVFPTNAIAVHDSWTNNCLIKSVSGVVFNGDGIVQPWVYTREVDQTTTNGQVACFSLYESDTGKDIGGYVDQPGQQTSVTISEHTESSNANFQFDQKSGRLISMKETDKIHDDFNMLAQGNPAEGHFDNDNEVSITLISP
jgi:hypothetical protein